MVSNITWLETPASSSAHWTITRVQPDGRQIDDEMRRIRSFEQNPQKIAALPAKLTSWLRQHHESLAATYRSRDDSGARTVQLFNEELKAERWRLKGKCKCLVYVWNITTSWQFHRKVAQFQRVFPPDKGSNSHEDRPRPCRRGGKCGNQGEMGSLRGRIQNLLVLFYVTLPPVYICHRFITSTPAIK